MLQIITAHYNNTQTSLSKNVKPYIIQNLHGVRLVGLDETEVNLILSHTLTLQVAQNNISIHL